MRFTKPKSVVLGFGLLTCLGIAGIVTLMFVQPRPPINPENFARIKAGMTEMEVVEVLGAPGQRGDGRLDWDGQEWVATIYFDKESLVSVTMFGPNQHSFPRKLLKWFGL